MRATTTSRLIDRITSHFDERLAVVHEHGHVSGVELVERIERRRRELDLVQRSLVALGGANTVDLVVSYLALLADGHVPLLAARDVDALADHWSCHASIGPDGVRHRHRDDLDLHPDLALLMSTSGSTGSPKLVRLSHANLDANATSIAEYLRLERSDRAVTTLPLSYCYGLSVLHSHLAVGASVLVTDRSVVDDGFTELLRRHEVTNLAGVPHTFELLERSGFDPTAVPSLRFVTQAGGRMTPERVLGWHHRLATAGADLVVMYGQTEATARMAYLPPELTATHPGSIGVPIPGGAIELRPVDGHGDGVGEIVYRGPNVMMGYATEPRDLELGAELHELATGDLARRDGDGVLTVVGRASRFVKPYGLRIDLDQVERRLEADGIRAVVSGDDQGIAVATSEPVKVDDLVGAARRASGLPDGAVVAAVLHEVPTTSSGKPDHAEVLRRVRGAQPMAPDGVRSLYATVFGREVRGDDTFVSLGGDSLRYVECALHLEDLVPALPADWHVVPVDDLERMAAVGTRRRCVPLDTTVVLRALAICAVVVTHMQWFRVPGGAHVMLAVTGYNLARFHAARTSAADVLRSGVGTVARVAAPVTAWIGVNMLVVGGYSLGALALVNNYFGSAWRTDGRWRYWYFEVFVQLVVLTTLLLLVPAVRRLAAARPFALSLALLAPTLALRFELVTAGDDYNALFRTHWVAWFFVLGWAAMAASRTWHRWLLSALIVVSVPGFFDRPQRDAVVVAGLLALVWVRSIPLPRVVRPVVATVAAASLWILLLHWQVWPPVDRVLLKPWAVLATIAVCTGAWWLVERAVPRAWRRWRQASPG